MLFRSFIILFIGFLIICTVYDLVNKKKLNLLKKFSLYNNALQILNTSNNNNDENLPAINGLRFLNITIIIDVTFVGTRLPFTYKIIIYKLKYLQFFITKN